MTVYVVYRGFQDEFRAVGRFSTKRAAMTFVRLHGWSLTRHDPVTPSVWISKE